MGRIFDAHCHLCGQSEWEIKREQDIISLACATRPEEAKLLQDLACQNDMVLPSYGLHPWHSGDYMVSEMNEFFPKGAAIGEIGMDSIWCDVPLEQQEKVFAEQLEIASALKLPVILHTKGQERQIGEIIRDYPLKYLVHWFSSFDYLDRYLELDCYFSAGPDLAVNPAVKHLIKNVPLQRIMVETDGWSAVRWALGDIPTAQIGCLLRKNMGIIANEKKITLSEAEAQMEKNFYNFIYRENIV